MRPCAGRLFATKEIFDSHDRISFPIARLMERKKNTLPLAWQVRDSGEGSSSYRRLFGDVEQFHIARVLLGLRHEWPPNLSFLSTVLIRKRFFLCLASLP